MRIALDFDGTFTADPVLWQNFVAMAKQRGHDVKIVTARHKGFNNSVNWLDNGPVEQAAKDMGVEIVYCGMQQKQDVYGADIWIDDRPDMVVGTDQLNTTYTLLNCS